MTCDPVQYLTHFGETNTLSEHGVAPAEKYLLRFWAVARSTTTAETFNQLRVEHYTTSSNGIDALPHRSSEIRGHIQGGAFRVNKACRLHVIDHEHYVTMVSYILFIYYVIFTQEYIISAQHCSLWGSCIACMTKQTSIGINSALIQLLHGTCTC